jgi:putative colanic acid biosysnthesis UDP-glucose lipid carrier transferase
MNVLIDYFLLNLALYVGFILENKVFIWTEVPDHYKLNFLLLNLFWFYSSTVVELYKDVLKRDADATIKATITSLLMFFATPIIIKLALPQLNFSNNFIIYFFILLAPSIVIWKTSFLLIRKSRRRFWINYRKIVILGANQAGLDLYKYIQENPEMGYKIEGIFDDNCGKESGNKLILGKIDDCFDYVKMHYVSEIYCALPSNEAEKIKSLMLEADKQMIRMKLVPDLKGMYDNNVMLAVYGQMPILMPRREPLDNKSNEFSKRAFDILFSLFVIVFFLSWLVPIIALIIKLESRGPIFFRQLRSGKDNKPFYCLKFRSMRVNEDSDKRQASKGDSRITKVGAFLRKTSMDELPQFINVLLGDMSVVGPRPHMLKHTEDYSHLIDRYMVRHFLTPGITGWAQVNGYRGETKETTSMSKRVDADIWYLENWSFFLDLKIVFLTVWQAIRGNENAY